MLAVNWKQVMAWRARVHQLHERAPHKAALEITSRICGLHAQVLSSAELTLWARVKDLPRDAVQRALWHDRTLVKMWAMRGTLHLLPAADYGLWQSALTTHDIYLGPAWLRYFGVSIAELNVIIGAIRTALDGRMLTRDELAAEAARITGSTDIGEKLRQSWGSLLKPACFGGHLCFAPGTGQMVRFTHPASWLKSITSLDPEEANRQAARRYLAAYGPATYTDFARWWGTTPRKARLLFESFRDELAAVDVEGVHSWSLQRDMKALAKADLSRNVRLLPGFDQYVTSPSLQAVHMMPGPFRPRIFRPQGWISPVLLINGRMDGVWSHQRKGSRVLVTVEPFVKVPVWAKRQAEDEAERLAEYLGGSLEVTWKPPIAERSSRK